MFIYVSPHPLHLSDRDPERGRRPPLNSGPQLQGALKPWRQPEMVVRVCTALLIQKAERSTCASNAHSLVLQQPSERAELQ